MVERIGALGTISKKPGDSLRCHDAATNTGNVGIKLGIAQVIKGPTSVGWGIKDYGVVGPNATITIDQTNTLPTNLPNGTYTHYLAVIDLTTNETLGEVATGWTVSVQLVKSVEITGIVLE